MDMIFTHFGISGPAVLRCSQFVVKELMRGRDAVEMHLDILPEINEDDLFKQIKNILEENPKKSV